MEKMSYRIFWSDENCFSGRFTSIYRQWSNFIQKRKNKQKQWDRKIWCVFRFFGTIFFEYHLIEI